MLRSYANTLLLVGRNGRRTAYVPRYRKPAVALSGGARVYPDADLLARYEAAVAGVLSGAGYRVVFVPADGLIERAGAIHCVAMQVRVPR